MPDASSSVNVPVRQSDDREACPACAYLKLALAQYPAQDFPNVAHQLEASVDLHREDHPECFGKGEAGE
ncbi:hypothetical protein AB0I39_16930 [Kitasatospora purpeofusca]|uniref:hypothetical protein n=1 Tax=Kitasatospora purpeofusca TaxID=67352 RepID=UPI0034018818